jgi:hypothetical protein
VVEQVVLARQWLERAVVLVLGLDRLPGEVEEAGLVREPAFAEQVALAARDELVRPLVVRKGDQSAPDGAGMASRHFR